METKKFITPIELKADGEAGEFKAIFSTFNVIDLQGDVTLPGAFKDGQTVRVSYWGHRWEDLPVGRGVIHADDEKAWIDGKFFMDTDAGLETYKTVKNLGELQEYSYGFDIDQADDGVFEGVPVRFLKALTVHEVSPVFLGAGIGTGTVAIKSAGTADGSDNESGLKPKPDGAHEDPEDGTDEKSGLTPEVVLTEIEILNSLGG
jgi:HK97 family phage prohead protease